MKSWQQAFFAAAITSSIGALGCPKRILLVLRDYKDFNMNGTKVGSIYFYIERSHQPFQSAFRRQAIQMIGICPALRIEKQLRVIPMSVVRIQKIDVHRLHHLHPMRR